MLDLLSRMAAHGVRELSFSAGTERAHILGAAWILCQEPTLGDGGARAMSRLSMLGAPGVRMMPVVAPTTTTTTLESEAKVEVATEPAPPADSGAIPRAPTPQLVDTPFRRNLPRSPRGRHPPSLNRARIASPSSFLTAKRLEQHDTAESSSRRLADAKTTDQIARALDALAAFTELPRKRIGDVALILTAMIARGAAFDARGSRSGCSASRSNESRSRARSARWPRRWRRCRTTATSYVRDLQVFRRRRGGSNHRAVRALGFVEGAPRCSTTSLVELQRGVPTLIYLLGDGRWYVVRNAAELLGEMRAIEAEQGLAWLVNHPDARVRRSATAALAKLDTPGARVALREATQDTSPDVRMRRCSALSNGDKKRVATQIIRALPDERDPDTQRTLMLILARLGTPEAIQYLLNAAEPEKGFFKKKPTPTRVAAVSALADATDPTALAAIRAMTKDKEREVRDAAVARLPPAKARASHDDAAGHVLVARAAVGGQWGWERAPYCLRATCGNTADTAGGIAFRLALRQHVALSQPGRRRVTAVAPRAVGVASCARSAVVRARLLGARRRAPARSASRGTIARQYRQ